MSKGKVLVFGSAGFMGGYLIIDLIKQGYEVVASDIVDTANAFYEEHNIPYVKVDITKKDDFKKIPQHQFEAVIHLAAVQPANVSKANYDPTSYINVNVLGTLNILEFCRGNGIKKIIYASSHRNTQGLWSNTKAVTEAEGRALKYEGEYAMFSISESAAQDCVLHYNAQYDLEGIIFRLPPVYGYGPHTEIYKDGKPIKTGFQIFIDNAKAGKPIELWGDSNKGRDILYVKDVITAFFKALDSKGVKGLFNITSGTRLTLRQEAETIAKVFWKDGSQPQFLERPEKTNSIEPFLYDISKAKNELAWSPAYSFEDMLHDFILEEKNSTYGYLIEKRRTMFKGEI